MNTPGSLYSAAGSAAGLDGSEDGGPQSVQGVREDLQQGMDYGLDQLATSIRFSPPFPLSHCYL